MLPVIAHADFCPCGFLLVDNSQMWDHITKTVGSVRFLSFW